MNMKKILAGLLAAVMLFAMVPVVAFATTATTPVDTADVYTVGGKTYFTTGHVAEMNAYDDTCTVVCQYYFVNAAGNTQYVNVGADGFTLLDASKGTTKKYYIGYDSEDTPVALQIAGLKEVTYNADAEQYEYQFEYTDADVFMSNDCYYVSVDGTTALTAGTTANLAAPKISNENQFYMGADLYMGVWAWNTQLSHWQAADVRTWDAFVLGNTAANGGYNFIGWYGWIVPVNDYAAGGVNHGAMTKLGYQFDDNDIVWVDGESMAPAAYDLGIYGTATPKVLAEDAGTAQVLGQPDVRRATLWIDLTPINHTIDTLHTMYLYAQDAEGNVYCLNNAMKGSANDPFLIEFGVARYDYTDGTNKYVVADDGYTLCVPQAMTDTGMVLGEKLDGTLVAAPAASIFEIPAPEEDTTAPEEETTEPETEAPTVNATASFKVINVTLGQALSFTYKVQVNGEFTSTPVVKYTLGDSVLVSEVEGVYEASSGRYVFKLEGINPQCIGDNILAEVYVDGVKIAERTNQTALAYLVSQAGKASTSEALKTLIYNTLAYGAAAQVYTGYKTDALVNAGFEDKVTNYDMGATTGADQGYDMSGNAPSGSPARFNAFSVNFGDVNKINVQFTGDVTLCVDGVAVDASELTYIETSGRWSYYTDGIFASELGKVFTFTLVDAEGNVVSTASYSVNAYAARNQNKVNNANVTTANNAKLAVALFNYGMAAKAYVGA